MAFARHVPDQRVFDFSRFIDTPRQKKDPCFHCTLPICVNGKSKECAFIQTPQNVNTHIGHERRELISELKDDGVILGIRGNGFIEWADDAETNIERRRRINREWMRQKRAFDKTPEGRKTSHENVSNTTSGT